MADFDDRTKAGLIAELAQSRNRMTTGARCLAEHLDFPKNLRRSFVKNQTGWLAGAAISGWILSRLPARRKKVKVYLGDKSTDLERGSSRSGMLMGMLKFGASVAKPAITALAKDKISELIRRRQV